MTDEQRKAMGRAQDSLCDIMEREACLAERERAERAAVEADAMLRRAAMFVVEDR